MSGHSVRVFISLGWLFTFLLLTTFYVIAFLADPVRPSFVGLMSSAAVVLGLISPHLSLVIEAQIDEKPFAVQALERSVASLLIAMCTSYWLLLSCITFYGVVKRITVEVGSGLSDAAAVCAGVSAIFSFLAVRPTIKLFAKHETPSDQKPGGSPHTA